MAEPMTAERFGMLLDAYGAEPRRWPDAERDAALAFLRTDARAAALLEEAARIDDALYAYRVPEPSAALAARVIAGAPRRAWRRIRLWWAALGLALAGAGGVLAGSAATAALAPAAFHLSIDLHDETTAFGDIGEEAGS